MRTIFSLLERTERNFSTHFELSRRIRIFTRSFCTDNYFHTKYPPGIAKLECFGGAPRTRVVAPRLRQHLNGIAPFFHKWIVCIEYCHDGKVVFFCFDLTKFPLAASFFNENQDKTLKSKIRISESKGIFRTIRTRRK